MSKLFSAFAKDESGATAIEYALLASLISIGIITAATTLGSKVGGSFTNSANAMK